jgi:hypothetical protein
VLRLKAELIHKFKGKCIEDVMAGQVVSNEQGKCYCVVHNHEMSFKRASYEKSKTQLLTDLKVMPGIGVVREQLLKNQGYKTIEDLKKHPIWRCTATEFLRLVKEKDVFALQERLRQRFPKSHPLIHYLAGFAMMMTLSYWMLKLWGCSGRPIILLGVADVTKDRIITRQIYSQ